MEFIGRGAICHLNQQLRGNVLLFTQTSVYALFERILKSQMENVSVTLYTKISSNPQREEIQTAQDVLKNKKFDRIIAFGGGSVIDFAKAYRFYEERKTPLIAIPTTAGTGSQATQFAVVYVNGIKTSLDNSKILPDIVIADSSFVENAPVYVKACCAMDAYCQAIESFWAKNSTEESKKYALQAVELCHEYLIDAVTTNDSVANEKMTLAAHLAGKAINISRTTAAHALSYKITSKYGIPHGHAVALSISGLFAANCESIPDINVLLQAMNLSKSAVRNYFHSLMQKIGMEDDLVKLGINDINEIVDSVNLQRLENNPKNLSRDDLINILIQN